MYMQVETLSSSRLHLKRAPGIRSWSLLVGILSIGLAAAYYSADSLGWKIFYVTGCLFVAVQNLEDWEEAIFDKSTGKVVLKTFSLYKKLLTLLRAGHDQVVVLLNDIRDVNVEEEKVRYFGKGYVVVLRFSTGFSHPLTQSAIMGHHSDVEAIARLIIEPRLGSKAPGEGVASDLPLGARRPQPGRCGRECGGWRGLVWAYPPHSQPAGCAPASERGGGAGSPGHGLRLVFLHPTEVGHTVPEAFSSKVTARLQLVLDQPGWCCAVLGQIPSHPVPSALAKPAWQEEVLPASCTVSSWDLALRRQMQLL
uniref:Essential for reactive oxygen species protein n=1 Tax=Myotis myotis TaxID=51298 RepID=A0A7J7R3L5_MYOMY|nr:cytochrome b-245 chaperone 1 [Myotis myotis]